MQDQGLNLGELYAARARIAGIARRTPIIEDPQLGAALRCSVMLKAENLQKTGSFKIRGAANKILSLSSRERDRGVIAVSTGNHGRAVSYVAREAGATAVVCVSEAVPENKLEAIRALGAELVLGGMTYDESEEQAERLREQRGLVMVHPFDDPKVIAGQGTIGIELLEDFPEVDTAIVPLSGGGLISGIGLALKAAREDLHLVGVTMGLGPAMVESLKAGRVVEIEEEPTLADALAGGIGKDNRYTFRLVQQLVDETVLLSESEIAGGIAYALEKHHLVLEGAGAVALAALLYGKVKSLGKNVAVVLSGGNLNVEVLARIASEGIGQWTIDRGRWGAR
jgi:threonine dehydratase